MLMQRQVQGGRYRCGPNSQDCPDDHMVRWSNGPVARSHIVAGSDGHMFHKVRGPPGKMATWSDGPVLPG